MEDEPIGADGIVDVETALQREIDNLAERFPHVERDMIDREVHEVYTDLARHATIKSHLVTVTGAKAGDLLRERGEEFQPRADLAEATEPSDPA